VSFKNWQVLRSDEEFDASCDTWLASDQTGAFERKNHLVNRGRRDLEMTLHVGLGRRAPEQPRIGIDEGQVLALLFGEAGRAWLVSGA